MMVKIRNKKEYKIFRAKLRKNMPAPELVLWQVLRRQSLGVKFRRQFSFNNCIFDFYAPSINLAIEIDGESHFQSLAARQKDRTRNEKLLRQGIKVLRLNNQEIMKNLEGSIAKILRHPLARERAWPTPSGCATPSSSTPWMAASSERVLQTDRANRFSRFLSTKLSRTNFNREIG